MRQAVRLRHGGKKSGAGQGRRVSEGWMLHSSPALVGKRDPMISNPAVYIFVPHGTKGAESKA